MNWKTIEVEFLEEGVVLVTLNRPDVLNAVDDTMRLEFTSLIPVLQKEEVRGVVFTGAGRAFCAGVDISRFEQDWSDRYFAGENYDLLDFFDANYFPDAKIHFYEDVPYSACYYDIDGFLARFETSYLSVRPWLEDISPVLDLKKKLCSVYRSQEWPGLLETIQRIAVRTAEFLASDNGAPTETQAAERFWTVEAKELLDD